MKRIALIVCTLAGMSLAGSQASAGWGQLGYSGYQPWWNIFAKRYKCMTPEEERLQKFWHDYYDALKHFYGALDNIDWVAYYKNHGYQINGGTGPYGCGRVNYAPVFVSPTFQWAVPGGCTGAPSGPGYGYPAGPGCGQASMGPMGGYPGAGYAGAGYPGAMPMQGPGVPMNMPASMPGGN